MQAKDAGGNDVTRFDTVNKNRFLTEMSELIKSVEIYVDS